MFLEISSLDIAYITLGFIFLAFSILMFYIGYRYYLRREDSREIGKDFHGGSFKGFWYRNNANIFIFLGFLFIVIGLALMIPSF